MSGKPSRPVRGYGVLMAAGVLLGFVVGLFTGQPSVGVVAGFAIAVAAALLLTLAGR